MRDNLLLMVFNFVVVVVSKSKDNYISKYFGYQLNACIQVNAFRWRLDLCNCR